MLKLKSLTGLWKSLTHIGKMRFYLTDFQARIIPLQRAMSMCMHTWRISNCTVLRSSSWHSSVWKSWTFPIIRSWSPIVIEPHFDKLVGASADWLFCIYYWIKLLTTLQASRSEPFGFAKNACILTLIWLLTTIMMKTLCSVKMCCAGRYTLGLIGNSVGQAEKKKKTHWGRKESMNGTGLPGFL